MKTTIKLWRSNYRKLGQIDFENPRNDTAIKISMRPQNYRLQARMISEDIYPGDSSILEIGCGYGGLANEILKIRKVSYTVVDNGIMLNQTRRFLGQRVEYIDAKEIETLHDRKFAMFISILCLSETPFEYREYILNNIIKNCRKIFIIDYRDAAKPTAIMKKQGYNMDILNTEKTLNKYFKINAVKYEHGRSMFIGVRRK